MITNEYLMELRESGRWGVRTSKNGIGYGGFIWQKVGEWTTCPKWIDGYKCDDGGLFFQGPGGYGHAQSGSRFEFIETDGVRISVGGDKMKTPRARIIAIGDDALSCMAACCGGYFIGSLDLSGTGITSLPDGLTVGGSLDLSGTGITSLPDGLTVGDSLYLSGTGITSLPDGLTVGGYLDLSGTGITEFNGFPEPRIIK